MTDWSTLEIKVILELAEWDEKGLSNKELTIHLDEDAPHITKVFKKLRNKGLIIERERGHSGKRTRKGELDDRSKYYPYSLIKDFSQENEISCNVDQKDLKADFPLIMSDPLAPILLSEARLKNEWPGPSKEELAIAFNNLIKGPIIYNEQLFGNVTLRQKTIDAINSKHHMRDCQLLNRLLLEDAFPSYLSRKSAVEKFSDFVKHLIDNERYEELEQFLGSNYINNIINEEGFFTVFGMVEKYLERKDINRACSILLKLPPAGEQFGKAIKMYRDHILLQSTDFRENDLDPNLRIEFKTKYYGFFPEFYSIWQTVQIFDSIFERMEKRREKLGATLPLNRQNYWAGYMIFQPRILWDSDRIRFDVLTKLDPVVAVNFFRSNIFGLFEEMFEGLGEQSVITRSTLKFLEYDVYLNPFTSYPFNEMRSLLFSSPFQRIYEDVFIFSLEDLDRMIERARLIYDYFSDFLFEDIKTHAIDNFGFEWEEKSDPAISIAQDQLATKLKGLIFYWNVASTSFDYVINYVNHFYDNGSGLYRLKTEGFVFDMFDLKTNRPVYHEPWDDEYYLGGLTGILPNEAESSRYMENAFAYLRPCASFGKNSKQLMKPRTFEDIFADLKSKLAKEKDSGLPIQLDWI
jgi:hypothetical protein